MAKPKKKAKITTFKKTKSKLRFLRKQKIEPAIKFPVVTLDTASLAAVRNIMRTELDLLLKSAQEIDNRKVQQAQLDDFHKSGGVIIPSTDGAAKKASQEPFA